MPYIQFPAAFRSVLEQVDQERIDLPVYRKLGVAIVRGALPVELVTSWMDAWRRYRESVLAGGRLVDPFNPVVLQEPVDEALAAIHRHPRLLDVIEQVYPDVSLYVQRFVIKDAASRAPVFLHQDYCYDLGMPEKTSIFLPLGPMSPANGGLRFYPGTHRLGYLGDAGELDESVLEPGWPVVAPTLQPGDLALMHECTWHASAPHQSGPDRVVLQMTFQPADDPSSGEVLRGRAADRVAFGEVGRDAFFKRSRSSRLRELQAALDRVDASRAPPPG